jgi:hypothetical protein
MKRQLIRAAVAVLLVTATACGTGGNLNTSSEGKKLPIVHPDAAKKKVHEYSSRIYQALAVKGRTGQSDYTQPIDCGTERSDVYAMAHYWQIDEVPEGKQYPALQRLRDYLKGEGWKISRFDKLQKGKWPTLRAENPSNGYTITSEGITEMKRIGIEVFSPCLKLPAGVPNPV